MLHNSTLLYMCDKSINHNNESRLNSCFSHRCDSLTNTRKSIIISIYIIWLLTICCFIVQYFKICKLWFISVNTYRMQEYWYMMSIQRHFCWLMLWFTLFKKDVFCFSVNSLLIKQWLNICPMIWDILSTQYGFLLDCGKMFMCFSLPLSSHTSARRSSNINMDLL